MVKRNQKCVRLSDRVLKYIEAYRGNNFSEKLENYILDTEERRDQMVMDWERLQAKILDQRRDLQQLHSRIQKTSQVDRRFSALVQDLLELMDA